MKLRGLSGVHLMSECALDKHVWRTLDVDHLGNTSRLRFSNSYISTDEQPAVRRTMGCPEKKQEMYKTCITVTFIAATTVFFLSVQQRLARICPAIRIACLASSSLKLVSTDTLAHLFRSTRVTYRPVFVMIISVPRSLNLSQRSLVSRWHSTSRSSSELQLILRRCLLSSALLLLSALLLREGVPASAESSASISWTGPSSTLLHSSTSTSTSSSSSFADFSVLSLSPSQFSVSSSPKSASSVTTVAVATMFTESFISVILILKYENRLDFDFQGNFWQPDEQKYEFLECRSNKLLETDQKKYDRATDVSFLLLRPTADHPESCHHQGPALKDVAREDGHKRNPTNNRLIGIVILSWMGKEELTPPSQIFTIVKNIGVNLTPLVIFALFLEDSYLIMMFNLTAHPYFISSKSSPYSLVIAHVRVALLRKSNFVRRIREQAWGNLLSETRANLRNSLIRMPFSRARRGHAYRVREGLNRFVTDPLISHMRGSSQCKKDESKSDFASWEIRRESAGI
ncbi:hypothetical protein G5I_04701 [Acromyrmex echinatior]|uniref:Uncharacterized protein n=1 Tax=Acromyrmex echinatior TaxID=103372 RepID=F4WGC7_ACREC|nr:hypothetical protein G5I_04701 [Acromyrmex echinatior]